MSRIFALTSLTASRSEGQLVALRSWRSAGLDVRSFNHPTEIPRLAEIYTDVIFVPVEGTTIETFGRHYVPIHVMCRWAEAVAASVLVVNSDIEIAASADQFERFRRDSAGGLCYFVRHNYDADHAHATCEQSGLDAFLFHGHDAGVVQESFLSMGQPWWDYWLPLRFARKGKSIWGVETPVIFHRNHAQNWSETNWHRCGLEFARCLDVQGADRSIDACRVLSAWARDEIRRRRKVLDVESEQPRSCPTCGDKCIVSFPEGNGMRIMACPACTAKRLDVIPTVKGAPS